MSDADTDLLDEPRLSEEHGVALHVARIVTPVLRDLGFRLVRIKISAQDGTTLQVMAERLDGTLTVGDCERISEALSPVLDVEDPIKQVYRLEVSSPGIDRPLMRVSDFHRAVGFEAKIEMAVMTEGRKRFRGMIDAVEDGVVALTRTETKPGEADHIRLPLADIADGRLILTDDLIRETLRAAKAAREAGDLDDGEGEEDEGAVDGNDRPADDTPTGAASDLVPPAKGPGRFALRNAGRQAKSRPLLPAGVHAGFKSKPNSKKPDPNGARKPR